MGATLIQPSTHKLGTGMCWRIQLAQPSSLPVKQLTQPSIPACKLQWRQDKELLLSFWDARQSVLHQANSDMQSYDVPQQFRLLAGALSFV